MGFTRFYLALCVALMHASPLAWLPMPNAMHAVQLFFIISGFYMAMILSGRYSNIRDFYSSRWSRIATPYYIHLGIIIALSLVVGFLSKNYLALSAYFSDPFSKNGAVGVLFAAFTNLTIFGQDMVLFLRDNHGEGIQFTSQFSAYPNPLWQFLVIPQCWTVSIELMFYLLVPFLNKFKTFTLLALCLSTFTIRILCFHFLKIEHDPWLYRFFPFEIGFFVVGMLSWRFLPYFQLRKFSGDPRFWKYFLLVACVLILGLSFKIAFDWSAQLGFGSYFVIAILLAAGPIIGILFQLTKRSSFDRALGELSYPIYINHLFFIGFFKAFPSFSSFLGGIQSATVVFSVASAWAYWHFFGKSHDERRHSKFLAREVHEVRG